MSDSAGPTSATYTITARRRKKRWILNTTVDGAVISTTTRRLDQVETLARRAIAKRLGVGLHSFAIELEVTLTAELQDHIDRTRQAIQQAAAARASAALLGHRTAERLKRKGLSRRDIGMLMGVSPRKVSKLLAPYRIELDIDLEGGSFTNS